MVGIIIVHYSYLFDRAFIIFCMKKFPLVFGAFAVLFVSVFSLSPLQVQAATSITTCAQLQNIGSLGLNGDYVLANNIDCSGIADFTPIAGFTGTLDGQGYTIDRFTIDQFLGSNKAMFSSTNGAIIRNIVFTNIDVDGYLNTAVLVSSATNTIFSNIFLSGTFRGDTPSGGIAATMTNSTITGSFSNMTMTSWSDAGHLVGRSLGGSVISTSRSAGSLVTLGSQVGGLVGVNNGSTIQNSHSSTSLSGGNSLGGLVGVNTGAAALIDRSYSVGNVGSIGSTGIGGLVGVQTDSATTTNSYWNTTTSGRGSSAGGTGRNTAQMQTQGTFVDWDFTNVWSISASQYPALRTPDTTAPAQVTGATGTAGTTNTVSLSWTNPTDVDFASITIKRSTTASPSNTFTGTTVSSGATASSFANSSLPDGVYYYSIFTIDTAGNISIPTRLTIPVDTTPPSAVSSLTASVTGSTVNLSWTNPGTDFGGIGIRRSQSAYPATVTDGDSVVSGLVATSRADAGLADGTYYYSVFVRDVLGNYSVAANVTAVVDTVLPVLTEVTPIGAGTTDTTPSYTFNTTRAGDITYGGSCSSATTTATSGNNTITFNALAEGTYTNCTIRVTDVFGNVSTVLSVSRFAVDTTAPTLTAGTPLSGVINPASTTYSFTANETGTYTPSGCGNVSVDTNTVTFRNVVPGNYSCTLSLTDAAGNVSNTITVGSFTIPAHGGVMAPKVEAVSGSDGPLDVTIVSVENIKEGRKVTFRLNANPSTVQGYAVSFDPTLSDTGIRPYTSTGSITLPTGSENQTLYVKYFSTSGIASSLITKTISGNQKTVTREITPQTEIKNEVKQVVFTRNLQVGMSGSDVKQLQQFMNANGFIISTSGNGSPGRESTYFGPKLKTAVMAYQRKNSITPASGIVGSLTRSTINRELGSN